MGIRPRLARKQAFLKENCFYAFDNARKFFPQNIELRKFPPLKPYSFALLIRVSQMKKSVTVVPFVRIHQLLCCSAAVLLAAATPTAFSAVATTKNLYVGPNGSDSNPGTQAAPFKTITRADSRGGAGYTIHVAPGTYKVTASGLSGSGILTTKSGTASARIKFISDVKGAAKIVVSGTGSAWNSKGSYVDIVGFDISGSGRHGILAAGANLTISENFIHDLTISGGCNGSGGAGIDTYGPVGNIVISANVIRNIGYKMLGSCNFVHGIYVANPKNTVINNVVSGAPGVGINQWHGATAGTIVNNTVFHNKIGILLGQGDGGATTGSKDNYVANNISYDNKTYGIVEGGKMGGNNRYVNNLVNTNGTNLSVKGTVSGTITSNPLFMSYLPTGTGNYRVHSGSPVIDRGTATLAPKVDVAGTARPRGSALDIGAYEF
jgi:hypothetical protein